MTIIDRTASAAGVGTLTGAGTRVITDKHFDGVPSVAVYLFGVTNVTIERCTFANVGAAIRLVECNNITIRDCAFWNILGGPPPGAPTVGNFVQLDKCDTAVIEDCWGVNDADGNPEDIISVFKSDHVIVRRNRFLGGGPSTSGSGILLGDFGGDDLLAEDNVLVDCGQVGIGVASGTNVTVQDNTIISTGRYSNANVGVFVTRFSDTTCATITVTNNSIRWIKPDGTRNPIFEGTGCTSVSISGNTTTSLSPAVRAFIPTGYYGWEV